MATRDSGQIGQPWALVVSKHGGGLRVERFAPGDDVEGEGEHIGDLSGTAREMGRQLRSLLDANAP